MQRYVFHFISPKKTQILSKDTDFGPCAICLCNNAFALTARMDNNPLPPGCRYALPLGYVLLRLQRDNYRHELQN